MGTDKSFAIMAAARSREPPLGDSLRGTLRHAALPLELGCCFFPEEVSSDCFELECRCIWNCLARGKHAVGRRVRGAKELVIGVSLCSHSEGDGCQLVRRQVGLNLPTIVNLAASIHFQPEFAELLSVFFDWLRISQYQSGVGREFNGKLVLESLTEAESLRGGSKQALPVSRR